MCHGQSALSVDQSLTAPKPLQENAFRIPKSRYSSVSLYISDHWMHRQEYDDVEAPYDRAIFERLQQHGTSSDSAPADVSARRPDKQRCFDPGIDSVLAKHISHLFIRDPIVIFSETIDQDDENSNDHFEVRPYAERLSASTINPNYVLRLARTSNQRIGRQFASSRHRCIQPSAGALSSDQWRFR